MSTTVEQASRLDQKQPRNRFPNPAIYQPKIRTNGFGRQLWPSEQYRKEDQLVHMQVIRKLWSWNMDQVWDYYSEPQTFRRLWSSDEYRSAGQGDEELVIRNLWQYYDGGAEDF